MKTSNDSKLAFEDFTKFVLLPINLLFFHSPCSNMKPLVVSNFSSYHCKGYLTLKYIFQNFMYNLIFEISSTLAKPLELMLLIGTY